MLFAQCGQLFIPNECPSFAQTEINQLKKGQSTEAVIGIDASDGL